MLNTDKYVYIGNVMEIKIFPFTEVQEDID